MYQARPTTSAPFDRDQPTLFLMFNANNLCVCFTLHECTKHYSTQHLHRVIELVDLTILEKLSSTIHQQLAQTNSQSVGNILPLRMHCLSLTLVSESRANFRLSRVNCRVTRQRNLDFMLKFCQNSQYNSCDIGIIYY